MPKVVIASIMSLIVPSILCKTIYALPSEKIAKAILDNSDGNVDGRFGWGRLWVKGGGAPQYQRHRPHRMTMGHAEAQGFTFFSTHGSRGFRLHGNTVTHQGLKCCTWSYNSSRVFAKDQSLKRAHAY